MKLRVSVSLSVYACACMCLCVSVYMCARACMCACACMCLCVHARIRTQVICTRKCMHASSLVSLQHDFTYRVTLNYICQKSGCKSGSCMGVQSLIPAPGRKHPHLYEFPTSCRSWCCFSSMSLPVLASICKSNIVHVRLALR